MKIVLIVYFVVAVQANNNFQSHGTGSSNPEQFEEDNTNAGTYGKGNHFEGNVVNGDMLVKNEEEEEEEDLFNRGGNRKRESNTNNIALKRPTRQSSTDDTLRSYLAVDGNKGTNIHTDGCSRTDPADKSKKANWGVKLADIYKVKSVVIYNNEGLSNSIIYVRNLELRTKKVCAKIDNMGGVRSKVFYCDDGATGNAVLIQKEDTGVLTLCEVEVYGDKVYTNNLALKRPTRQSSSLKSKNKYKSYLAVDGNKGTHLISDGCTHTDPHDKSTKANWGVRLADIYKVKIVIIYNRSDCCSGRLSNSIIYVRNLKLRTKKVCVKIGNMRGVRSKVFYCDDGATGNAVLIQKEDTGPLMLCEVIVYGDKV